VDREVSAMEPDMDKPADVAGDSRRLENTMKRQKGGAV